MKDESISVTLLKVLLPMALGGAILYWMYRGFDFDTVAHVWHNGTTIQRVEMETVARSY